VGFGLRAMFLAAAWRAGAVPSAVRRPCAACRAVSSHFVGLRVPNAPLASCRAGVPALPPHAESASRLAPPLGASTQPPRRQRREGMHSANPQSCITHHNAPECMLITAHLPLRRTGRNGPGFGVCVLLTAENGSAAAVCGAERTPADLRSRRGNASCGMSGET